MSVRKFISFLCISTLLVAACTKPAPVVPDPNPGEDPTPGEDPGEDPGTDPDKPTWEVDFNTAFEEGFSGDASEYFDHVERTNRDDFRYFFNYPSYSEVNTRILMLCMDPQDAAGITRGPQISTKNHCFYGSYSARLRLPNIAKAQPNLGAVAALSVTEEFPESGLSEIAIEWRLAEPSVIYLRASTGIAPQKNNIFRTINLATGKIIETAYKTEITADNGGVRVPNSGELSSEPLTISAISGYNASTAFYTYGFDWRADGIKWWIQDPKTKSKIVLWEYVGDNLFKDSDPATGIPATPVKYAFNLYHSKLFPAEGKPSSTQAPLYPFELELDSMAYTPYELD